MGIFNKLFGRREEGSTAEQTDSAAGDPARGEDMIRVFDRYGRELFITRQEWRDNVLLGNLQAAWDRPDDLYGIILNALNDGFHADVVQAAEQLHKIDDDRERSTCIWAIVLMHQDRFDEAETVLRDYLGALGESGAILTNLAKVHAGRNDHAQAERTLWHALEVDPNLDNGLMWYLAIHHEREGEAGSRRALERVAALDGSWRAPLWLARAALEAGELGEATASYTRSLKQAQKPYPPDLLMQMSGDLGNHGRLRELLSLTEPHFDVELHGLEVGNNLIKAHLDLGHLDQARELLDRLYAQGRPDWKETLQYWDTEIAKARVGAAHVDDAAVQIGMLSIEGPVWLKPGSRAAALFPEKPKDEIAICFLGSSATQADAPEQMQLQLADAVGRMSRALPLFLAEQTHFATRARVLTLVPWINEGHRGFVLSGQAWRDEEAVECVRGGGHGGDLVVTLHLRAESKPWHVEARVVRTAEGRCVATFDAPLSPDAPDEDASRIAERLLAAVTEHAQVRPQPMTEAYSVPRGQELANYLLRLEQLLAVRCAAMDHVGPDFLNGEREILDGNLDLCLFCPDNVTTRLLLAQTVLYMRRVRPDVVDEFREKLQALQQEHALDPSAQAMLNGIFNEALTPD